MKILKKDSLLALPLLFIIVAIVIYSVVPTFNPVYGSPTSGIISIAFDDNYQTQFTYAFPIMSAKGIVGTFYVVTSHIRGETTSDSQYMNLANLQTLQNSGNEIGSHSVSHPSFASITDQQIINECVNSKSALANYGFSVNNFAFPDGNTNDHIDSIVSQYYRSGRTAYVAPYVMSLTASQFRLSAFTSEESISDLTALKAIVDKVHDENGWAIVFFHNIVPVDLANILQVQRSLKVF